MISDDTMTQTKESFPRGLSLVAETDPQGVFTAVNDAFVGMCGVPREALIGRTHESMLHPDMPHQVFAYMHKELAQNRPWRGVVKYCGPNGGYFWADMMSVPIREGERIVGHLAVCGKAGRSAVAQAERDYQYLRESDAPAGPSVSLTDFLSVKAGVIIGIVFVSLMMIVGGFLGISGLNHSDKSVETVYRNQLKPALMIGRISFLMADNRSRIALALQALAQAKAAADPVAKKHLASRTLLSEHAESVERNKQEIDEIWASFSSVPRHEHEAALARDYWTARQAYADDGLARAIAALENGDLSDAERVFRERVIPLYDDAAERADRLLGTIRRNAENELRLMVESNDMTRDIALFGIAGGLLVVGVSGAFFLLGVVRPLDQAVSHVERIARGDLAAGIDIDGGGETGRLSRAIAIMQLRLKVIIDEVRSTSSAINTECAELNEATMALVERYDEEHDRIHHLLDRAGKARNEEKRLHAQAASALDLAESALDSGEPPNTEVSRRLLHGIREIAASALLQTYVNDDTVRNLSQVADLVVDNRHAAQETWRASEKMTQTAAELATTVSYFKQDPASNAAPDGRQA